VANNKANLHQAQVNLGYAEIYSPIDGIIIDRAVEMGQTVAASFNTPTMFTIAADLTKMQVEADVDEADIGRVREGQPVNFTVDAYPDDIFEGTVVQIRLQPTVTNNVVTYTVIVEAPNPDVKLYPGMTASITIITQNEKGLTVPAEALYFTPTEELLAVSAGQHGSAGQPGQSVSAGQEGQPVSAGQAGQPQGVEPSHDVAAVAASKTVWLKTADGGIAPQSIRTGLSDGVKVIVTEGLKAGDEVILSVMQAPKAATGAPVSNPLMPGPPGRNKK